MVQTSGAGQLTLENMKDRSIAIFGIYLQMGRTFYVELEIHEENPVLLNPFGTYSNQYDPVDFYSVNMGPIDIDKLWTNESLRIVLSTSEGKYIAKNRIKRWFPVSEQLRNYNTAVIRPMRTVLSGRSYGSNVRYVVEFEDEGGEQEVVPLHHNDYRVRKFKEFSLTEESLESKENLESFFWQRLAEDSLNCKSFKVYDWEAVQKEAYKDFTTEAIQAEPLNWIEQHVLTRVLKLADSLKDWRRNKLPKKRN